MTHVLLWLLATLDAMFAGYRDAAGRCALIDKRRYDRRALLRGALAGQVVVVSVGLVVALLYGLSPQPVQLMGALHQAGQQLLVVYVPFALVVCAALLVRVIPSIDGRSLTSTLVLGPCTLIRPAVIVLGISLAIARTPQLATLLLGGLIALLMLGLGYAIGKLRAYGF